LKSSKDISRRNRENNSVGKSVDYKACMYVSTKLKQVGKVMLNSSTSSTLVSI
jgi:hypothetical protein